LFPRMKAIAHHAGAGTTAAASRSGAPQIPVPHFIDQPLFADRLMKRGVAAAVIPRKTVTVDKLAAALHAALNDQGLQQRARALAEALSTTNPRRNAVAVLEKLAGGNGVRGRTPHRPLDERP
jgi:sterol 3beta-glucosyltransferase